MSAVSVSGTASVGQVADRAVDAVLDGEPALGDEHAHRLDRVQRDAVGARDDGPDRRPPAGPGTRPASSARIAGSGQRLEVQRVEVALAGAPVGPPLEQLRARRA